MSNKVVEGLYYIKTHEWVIVEGDVALIGSDYAPFSDVFCRLT